MKRFFVVILAIAPLFFNNASSKTEWIALEDVRKLIVPGVHFGGSDPKIDGTYRIPQFRCQFKTEGKIRRANARVCGLGHFEFMLNGEKVGDHFLDPGWTCYDKEALYVDFDVTKQLLKGENTIDVLLGTGFYTTPRERYYKLICSYGQPKLWMELDIEYRDGHHQLVATDAEHWQVCESPITFSSMYGGESYDARRETMLMWQDPVVAPTNIRLIPQEGTELKVRRYVHEKRHFQDPDGNWIYDLGQNFSGIVRMSVTGERGKEVNLWPSELLDDKGKMLHAAAGYPYHWDYTLRGDREIETWQPRFTYYGQRYVMVKGAVPMGEKNPDNLPVITELVGLHTCAAVPETGTFTCGDSLFCKVHELIDWAIRSNMQSVLTDCPHREKLGWMEQDYLMQYSIQYRYDALPIYNKVLNDMEASQWDNGCIPTIAPMYVMFEGGFEDTPEWGSAFIICPWYAYQWYGDRSLIERHYPAMKRYIAYLGSRANNNIVAYGLGDWFDLGPGPSGRSQLTSNGVTATAIYFYDVTLMARMAKLLGHNDDAEQYEKLAAQIKKSFNDTFYHAAEGYYDKNSQTANAMPLYVGLVEKQNEEKVLESLINDIRQRGYALTAGDIGYRFVLQALQEAGRSDVIYKMNSRTDVPGYGWQLEHGATTLTENWQASNDVSQNHLMLGHLMEWLYGGLGGIRQTKESVGFKHLFIAPQIIKEIGSVKTSLQTPQGFVESSWELKDGKLNVFVNVPKGCDAVVSIPDYSFTKQVKAGKHKFQLQ